MMETTLDKLLNSRFEVEQPAKGFRIAVDTLLLASAIPAQDGQQVLEFGCGVGGVMLALATRLAEVRILGLEIQPDMVALCDSNIRRNGFEGRLEVRCADIVRLEAGWCGAFDHVAMNPPYHDPKKHGFSPILSKKTANTESEDADLALWLEQGASVLKDGGVLSMIHRADRCEEITNLALQHFGAVAIKPILSRPEVPAKRILVRAMKGGVGGLTSVAPIVMYNEKGRYSAEAELILREAKAISFQ